MPDNSQFVMPKAQMDDLVARTGGDVGKLEQALGIPEGAWTNREMVQINIATPRDFNVRMPSGNEMGANNLWLPGGRLPTGQLEAVVDQIPKGGYTESLLPQAGKNLTPSNAPALNLAPAGHGMKPVTNPPAPATPVKAHTSANQANQGSHPVADPGASPTVKRAINALQEGSPDTRIGKTELQFREAVEGGAKGVVANTTKPLALTERFGVAPKPEGTYFRYGNPDYWPEVDSSHGITGFVDKNGTLGFNVYANPELRATHGSGTDMFNGLWSRVQQEGIQVNGIQGSWIKGTDSVNYAQYRAGLASGLSPEQSALNTWTGRLAQQKGFTTVESVSDNGNVFVMFRKQH